MLTTDGTGQASVVVQHFCCAKFALPCWVRVRTSDTSAGGRMRCTSKGWQQINPLRETPVWIETWDWEFAGLTFSDTIYLTVDYDSQDNT